MLPAYVALGGMFGALARYVLSGLIQNGRYFPAGTLGVNVIGSFFLGFFMFSSEYFGLFSQEVRAFIAIGFLGSFTTMSTFSYESFRLLSEGNLIYFLANILLNVAGCIAAVYAGRAFALTLWRMVM
ncbi:fluoride efflux transporter CrcB [Geoglobus acetivorans]|uniref:Fluoride-specific ion channel FluC n=1 Tax=Geoglobus acetivorans TaxID=565033 RepID=A0ABZ3H442_GEOAI